MASFLNANANCPGTSLLAPLTPLIAFDLF